MQRSDFNTLWSSSVVRQRFSIFICSTCTRRQASTPPVFPLPAVPLAGMPSPAQPQIVSQAPSLSAQPHLPQFIPVRPMPQSSLLRPLFNPPPAMSDTPVLEILASFASPTSAFVSQFVSTQPLTAIHRETLLSKLLGLLDSRLVSLSSRGSPHRLCRRLCILSIGPLQRLTLSLTGCQF